MTRTRLQLALDFPQAFAALAVARDHVDIVEVGTPLLKRFGLAALSTAREIAPRATLLADSKTVDGGAAESAMLYDAGADLITVLSCAAGATLSAVSEQAERRGKGIVVDTITEPDPRAAALRDHPAGVAYVSLHTPTDARLAGDARPADLFALAREVAAHRDVVVAGGIDLETIARAASVGAAVVVAGRAITTAVDPAAVAAAMREALS